MRCPKCQFENRAAARFCRKCGGSLQIRCPACGALHEPETAFCDECGRSLMAATVTLDYSQPRSYTPTFLADKILTGRQGIEGERKLVTVLFADVADYTSISERLDPEEVHHIMDACFKSLIDEIHRYEGTIDKFTGDGVMALFGAPLAHEDHAQRACYAALAVQKAISEYGDKVKKDRGIDFRMRVGLNSGPVIVGTVGPDLRMDYTAVGDTVNLASRMQTMAEPGRILVTADVHRFARDFFNFKVRGKLAVKGKGDTVEAFELLEPTEVATRMEASVVRGLTRFVGREKEMTALKEAWEKARSGSGQVACIVGEAGVGKSRLLLEFRRILESEPHTYLEGHCLHYGSSMPYLPLLDILRSYFSLKEGEREFLVRKRVEEKISALDPNMKAVLPVLQELLSLKVEDEAYLKLEPQKKREKSFEAIRDVLITESRRHPLVVAVEDLHWLDKTSEDFLAYLIGHLSNSRILLLLLYRPEYTHQWASKACYTQIRVNELPSKSSIDLVRALLEEGEIAPELRELILNRSAGNPLFMEEFTHTLLENGSIEKKDHRYVLSRKPSEINVPDTIQGIIAARMDRLDENLKRIMQVASVIGRDFAYRVLQTITGMQEELKSQLINLQGLEFIYEKNLYPELEYVFKHALTQEVAYNSLLLKRRKEIHQKTGQAIEELHADRLEQFYEVLAHHYSKAEDTEKAYHYLKLSGEKATRSYAKWEGLAFYQSAVDLLKRQPDTEQNKRKGIEIRLLMSDPMRHLSFPEGSLTVLEEGERLCRQIGDEKSLAHFLSILSWYYALKGDAQRGLAYSEDCVREAEKAGDVDLVAPIGFQICSNYWATGDLKKMAQVASSAVALIGNSGRERDSFGWGFNLYSIFHAYWGSAIGWMGNFEEGERLCEKGLRLAREMEDLQSATLVEVTYAVLHMGRGDGRKTVAHAENAIRLAGETGLATIPGLAWGIASSGHLFLGELDAARECTEKGEEHDRTVGMSLLSSGHISERAEICLELGDWEQARAYVEQGLECARSHGEKLNAGLFSVYLGAVLAKVDASQAAWAEECIVEGIRTLDELKIRPFVAVGYLHLGTLYADTGRREGALTTLKKAKTMFQEMGMDYHMAKAEKTLEKL